MKGVKIMAILKVLNGKGKYHDIGAREVVARYICNLNKAESGLMGGVGVDRLETVIRCNP